MTLSYGLSKITTAVCGIEPEPPPRLIALRAVRQRQSEELEAEMHPEKGNSRSHVYIKKALW
jgi:hypothetical protein